MPTSVLLAEASMLGIFFPFTQLNEDCRGQAVDLVTDPFSSFPIGVRAHSFAYVFAKEAVG